MTTRISARPLSTAVALWVAIRLGAYLPWLALVQWRPITTAAALGGVIAILAAGGVRSSTLLLATVAVGGLLAGAGAWWAVTVPSTCSGPARVVSEARATDGGVVATIQVGESRLRARAYGSAAARLQLLRQGSVVDIVGKCSPVRGPWTSSLRSRHVVAMITVESVAEDHRPPAPLALSINRVHDLLAVGARTMQKDDRELFLGLVVGADDRQPRSMVEDFRASGLGHLTAVSGQNVAYVLSLLAWTGTPARSGRRLMLRSALLGWFALLTRLEPSVVRATSAALLDDIAGARGWQLRPVDASALSIIAALVVDPLLAHSVGFVLSSSAALGVVALAPRLALLLGDTRFARAVAVPLAAQLATAPVAVSVFARLPPVALVCNLLATPVAAAVMLLGLPFALASSVLPETVSATVMFPVETMVRWVWWVAHLGARVPDGWSSDLCGWVAVLTVVAFLARGRLSDHRRGGARRPRIERAARSIGRRR